MGMYAVWLQCGVQEFAASPASHQCEPRADVFVFSCSIGAVVDPARNPSEPVASCAGSFCYTVVPLVMQSDISFLVFLDVFYVQWQVHFISVGMTGVLYG